VAITARENVGRAGLPRRPLVAHNALGLRLSEPEFLRAIRGDPRLETRFVPTLSGGISISTWK
jgi:hypothetical protein